MPSDKKPLHEKKLSELHWLEYGPGDDGTPELYPAYDKPDWKENEISYGDKVITFDSIRKWAIAVVKELIKESDFEFRWLKTDKGWDIFTLELSTLQALYLGQVGLLIRRFEIKPEELECEKQ